MSGELLVKDASASDVQGFLAIAGDSLQSFRYFDKRPLETIHNHLKTIVVIQANSPIGYGHLDPEDGTTWLGICVAEKFKGLGLGNLIMSELVKSAINSNVSEIHLSVDRDNKKATHLYEKFGFQTFEKAENVIFMKLVL